ncbi:hypothetical protein FHR87_003325 [Azomonas macrocytogenes]|uniref:Uncharacterized protein n=1 Tax=Azomonas macrocytogenes TaxID=69962 RepID=A0A839T5V4_AZOMA|nr:hypothetical protein [Azomonas macrocytogenes]
MTINSCGRKPAWGCSGFQSLKPESDEKPLPVSASRGFFSISKTTRSFFRDSV